MKYVNIYCVNTFNEARRLFAITYVLEINISVFREIVKMSLDNFRIFDHSRIAAFIKHFVYWGFLEHRSNIGQYLQESAI